MFQKYTCALSGKVAPFDEQLDDGSLPEGWVQITVHRRFVNPKWEAIQDVKQSLIQQTLAQIPEEQREAQLVNVVIQVEAQYALLEDKTPEYINDDEIVYISPPEADTQLFEAYNEIREHLGLEKEELIPEDPEPSESPVKEEAAAEAAPESVEAK